MAAAHRRRQRAGVRLDGLERGADLHRLLIALRGLLGQAALDDRTDHRRNRRRQRSRRLAQNRGGQIVLVASLERQFARGSFIQHDSKRPDIAPLVGIMAEQHLRRQIRKRPGDAAPRMIVARSCRRRLELGRNPPRKAEVEHFRAAIGADDDIGGLQIAMNDAPFVRVRERVGDLNAIANHRISRKPAGRNRLRERSGPRQTPSRCTPGLRCRRSRRRCRYADGSGPSRARLLNDARAIGWRRAGFARDHLDGNGALQLLVLRSIDHAHAAGTSLDRIRKWPRVSPIIEGCSPASKGQGPAHLRAPSCAKSAAARRPFLRREGQSGINRDCAGFDSDHVKQSLTTAVILARRLATERLAQ